MNDQAVLGEFRAMETQAWFLPNIDPATAGQVISFFYYFYENFEWFIAQECIQS